MLKNALVASCLLALAAQSAFAQALYVKPVERSMNVPLAGPAGDRTRCDWLVWIARDLIESFGGNEGSVSCKFNGVRTYTVHMEFGGTALAAPRDPDAVPAHWRQVANSWGEGGASRAELVRAILGGFATRAPRIRVTNPGDTGRVELDVQMLQAR